MLLARKVLRKWTSPESLGGRSPPKICLSALARTEMQAILNVDDYHPSRYARTKLLQQAGFNVIEAATGQAALDAIYDKKPVLVLLDVNLPDISGFEICRRIK